MPTIIRQDGFDVMIFTNDHRPAHVHLFKASAEVILTLAPVRIRENYRMPKKEVRKAVEIVSNNEEIHGNE